MAKSPPRKSPATRSAKKKPPAAPTPVIRHILLLGPTLARRKQRAKEKHALVRVANRMARVRTMRHSYIAKANNSSEEADRQNVQTNTGAARDTTREEIERESGGQHMLLSLKQGKSGPEVPVDENTESQVTGPVKSSTQSDREEVYSKVGLQAGSSDDRAEGKEESVRQPAKKRVTESPPRKSGRKKAASSLANSVTPDAVKSERRFQDGDAKSKISKKMSAKKSAKDPPLLEGSTQKDTREEKYRIFLKQQRALSALMTSTDLISIQASLGLVKEIFKGYDDVTPEVFQLANDAELTSRYLMFQSLRDSLTQPISFGGLAFSDLKATSLINQLLEAMGPRFDIEVTSIEKMQLVGASNVDSRKILPFVKAIGEGVRKKGVALRKEINDSVITR